MAKFVQPNIIFDSSVSFLRNVTFDSSVYLQGVAHISNPNESSSATPYALVVDTIGNDISINAIQLGTMATATAADYTLKSLFDSSVSALKAKDTQQDASLALLFTKNINQDTSLNNLWDYNVIQDVSILAEWERWVDSNRTGFVDNSQTTPSFADGTATFTLADAGSGWDYYRSGEKFHITGNKTVQLPGGASVPAGIYYIYIDSDDGTLIQSTTPWSDDTQQVFVATVTWDSAASPKYLLGEERHTMLIDRRVHKYLHSTVGTAFVNGGALTGPDYGSSIGVTDASNAVGIAVTTIADEDLFQTLATFTRPATPLSSGGSYNMFYRTGASDWSWRSEDTALPESGSYIEYDNGSGMTAATDGKFVNSYILYTNLDGKARFSILAGQAVFDTVDDAINENPAEFDLTGFPGVEYIIAWQLTWATSSALSTKGKVYLAVAPKRVQVTSTSASAPTTTSHNSLLGLQGGNATERYHLSLAQWLDYAGKSYIDASLSVRDTRLTNLDTSVAGLDTLTQSHTASIAQLDASVVRIDAVNAQQDASIVALRNKDIDQDASIVALRNKDIDQDASIVALRTRVSNHDTSIAGLDTLTQAHTAELLVHDLSIGFLWSYDQIQDASIVAAGTSVTAWNGLIRTDNSIGLGGTGLVADTIIYTNSHQLAFDGTVQITGDLTVDGSITYLNTDQLDVSDNIIYINTGLTGAPPVGMVSGMKVNRGTSDPYFFIFSEADDTFRIGVNASEGGLPGGTQAVATREDSPNSEGIAFWNDTAKRFDTVADFTFNAGTGLSIADAITATGGMSLSGLSGDTQTYALMTTAAAGGTVSTRALGSNAFNSDAYVLQSLFDTSIASIWTKFGNVDTSLNNIWTKFGNVDTSIASLNGLINTNITDITNIETSLGSLNGLINTNILDIAQLDASIVRIDASLNDVIDVLSLGFVTETSLGTFKTSYIDPSLNAKLNLAGGTMTGVLTFAAGGFSLDSVTITDIDVSGFLTGLDTHIPTSGAVQQAISEAIASGVTASNGLTESPAGNIKLGGTLEENTTVDTSSHSLTLGSGPTKIYIERDASVITLTAANTSQIELGNQLVYIATGDGTGLTIDGSSMTVTSNDNKGIKYFTDYSATFDLESLITKRFVLAQVGDSSARISNLESSVGALDTLTQTHTTDITNIETSLGTLNGLINTNITDIGYLETSVGALDTLTQAHTAELLVHDLSIGFLWSYDQIQDASIAAAGTSVKAWNGLTRDDNSIGLGGSLNTGATTITTNGATASLRFAGLATSVLDTALALVQDSAGGDIKSRALGSMAWATATDYTLKSLFDSSLSAVWTKFGYVDTSLNNIWTKFGYVDTSMALMNTWNINQDASIAAISSAQGNYLPLTGGTLTGDLTVDTSIIIKGSAIFQGNAYFDGSAYFTDVETINVSSGYIHLNTGLTGPPPSNLQSGIIVGRGSSDPYAFVYDESDQTFRIGIGVNTSTGFLDTDTQAVATREDNPEDWGIGFWNETENRIDTSAGFTFTPGAGLGLPIATNMAAEATALVWNGTTVGSRELGSNAFNSDDYVLQSLFDTSIASIWTKFGNVDTSLNNIWTKLGYVDTSISGLDTLTQSHTASISSLNQSITDLSTNKLDGIASTTGVAGVEIYAGEDANHVAYIKRLVAGAGATITSTDSSTISISVTGSAGYVSKYVGTFDGTAVSPFTITAATHGLGTGPLMVTTWESGAVVYTGVDVNGSNDVTLSWSPGSLVDASCKFIITG